MASSTPSDDPIPKTLKWMENDLGKTARFIWQNIEDPTQREHQLRGLFGDAYPQIEQEIANKYPPSVDEISVRDMSKSAFGRELYNAILNLTAKVSRIEENQRIQEERAERDHRSIIDFGNSLEEIRQKTDTITEKLETDSEAFAELKTVTVDIRQKTDTITEKLEIDSQAVAELKRVTISAEKEQKSLSAEIMRIQEEIRQKTDTITEKLETDSEALAELKTVTENAERTLALLLERQKDLEHAIADVKSVMVDIRQKTDTITEKLEIDSQAVAELKRVTISAEKEQKSLSAEIMRIQESLNGIIENTSEMKRKQDFIYAMQFWDDKRKFEKFIGRWKLVKWERDGVEKDISKWIVQSYSFEPVPEGVMWRRYGKDGSESNSFILTTDKEIENKLRKEGKRCELVEFQTDSSFKRGIRTYNVEGNHLIERYLGDVLTYEKC